VSWLSKYRQSLRDGSSARVVRAAGWIMFTFTALWAVGLFLLLKMRHSGGSGTSTVIGYVALLIPAFLLYSIVKLLFLPFRR
jgi:lipopolysaccharide export LptBFGC system permease protein LptF